MNKTYIKRQITLYKLGLPMSEDIKEYYDYFHHLIGNINDLGKMTHDDYPDSIFWTKGDKVILEYNIKNDFFNVDYHTIWSKFKEKYGFNYEDTNEIFVSMLGECFRLSVTTTYHSTFIYFNYR